MNNIARLVNRVGAGRLAAAIVAAATVLAASGAAAQVPARFYWKSLSGGNAVPVIFNSISGNTNPFDPAHIVTPDSSIDGTLAIAGYAHTFSMFDRAAMAAILLPMGRVSGDVNLGAKTINQSADGFGDPMLEFNINIFGPPAQKNLADALRYQPGFSVDLLFDLAIPIGEYNNDQALNLGQHRWYGRVGAPIVWQIGAWVPGQRTTLEFLPALWLFGNNNDYLGQTLKTDPLFQLDAHLTRDFTEKLWGSVDVAWYSGGQASINGVSGQKLNNVGAGLTLGYQINDNLNLTLGYKSTFNDNSPGDLRLNAFMLTFVYGWHPLIEGSKRLKSE